MLPTEDGSSGGRGGQEEEGKTDVTKPNAETACGEIAQGKEGVVCIREEIEFSEGDGRGGGDVETGGAER